MILKIKYQFNKKYNTRKNRGKLLQKQNDYRNKNNTDFKKLHKTFIELQNKLKA